VGRGEGGCTGQVRTGIVGFPYAGIKIFIVGVSLFRALRSPNASQQSIWACLVGRGEGGCTGEVRTGIVDL